MTQSFGLVLEISLEGKVCDLRSGKREIQHQMGKGGEILLFQKYKFKQERQKRKDTKSQGINSEKKFSHKNKVVCSIRC